MRVIRGKQVSLLPSHIVKRTTVVDEIQTNLRLIVLWYVQVSCIEFLFYFHAIRLLDNVSIHRKVIADNTAVAKIGDHFHKLFKDLTALDGPELSNLAKISVVGFSLGTIIYFVYSVTCIRFNALPCFRRF